MNKVKFFGVLLGLLTLAVAGCSDSGEQASEPNISESNISSAKVADIKTTQPVVVYKSPTCGCCGEWVEHLEKAGFHSLVKHPEDLNVIKNQFNIEPQYQSCHTAVHGDFVFEGHIPAKFIQQFLDNPPSGATGLAVPAMPLGSPGMEMGERFTPYTIFQLNSDGQHTVFAEVSRMEDQY